MSKFYGKIGFFKTVEKENDLDVWEDKIVEMEYYGDYNRFSKKYVNSDSINDNISITGEISIVADEFAYHNFQNIRYVDWNNQKWRVASITPEYPRLNLTLGEVYYADKQKE